MVVPRVASPDTQRVVNWLAAQWRIQTTKNKKKSDSKNPDDVQNSEDEATAAATVGEMLDMKIDRKEFDADLNFSEEKVNMLLKDSPDCYKLL